MALSRIWSAFVIIAFLVAGIKFISGREKNVFSSMVVGKAGDSIELKRTVRSAMDTNMVSRLDSVPVIREGNLFYKKKMGKRSAR